MSKTRKKGATACVADTDLFDYFINPQKVPQSLKFFGFLASKAPKKG